MLFGVDYYPEHWDKSEWEENARLMREANFNVVRLAEFGWRLMEPEEGVFDFSWLDDAIAVLAQYGIKVILGTPTASPPKWLVNKYDVYQRDKYLRPRPFGSRRSYCGNNPVYIEKTKIIVEKMAEHYADNPNVIAWQVDNEFGCHNTTRCYCEHCRKAFGEYLSRKFTDIDALNKAYGTVFWSMQFDSFDDIILPAYSACDSEYGNNPNHNPALELDYSRFASDTWVKYQQIHIDILRRYTDKPITHNLMGHFSDIDYYKLSENLDIASWDNYPDNQWGSSEHEYVSMAHEIMRGVKDKNFWVMEEQSGPAGWNIFGGTPRPGELRLWTYQAIAHGAEGIIYFRFKSAPFGMEEYWLGILDCDGIPRRRYYELQKTGEELLKNEQLFIGAEQVTDALLVKSYEDNWSHRIKSHVRDFDYNELLYRYYKANNDLGVNPVCGSVDRISNQYKIVYMPACILISDELQQKLEDYVKNGGTLVLTCRSGVKDMNNNMVRDTVPGRLKALAGLTAQEFDSTKKDVPLSNGGISSYWRDIIVPDTAETIASYDAEFYKETPAITRNSFGKGTVYYIGCDLDDLTLEKLAKEIADHAGATYTEHPAGTEVVKRRAADGTEYYMLLNFTEQEQKIDKLNTAIEPYGVKIMKEN